MPDSLNQTPTGGDGTLAPIDPELVRANPNNPRRYFNEERLDLLKTSIQEVGVLVPIIVYRDPDRPDGFVLMDGERRWRCSLDLGLLAVPANIIEAPGPLDNLLRMFNIHNVREDWPLVSVALSLREVMSISGESGEKRLSEMTGLTRSTVRRAKRLLSIPDAEIELIQNEAHLDRSKQVHREDLYLEIEAAESVLRSELPDVAADYSRADIIRAFAEKAEVGSLKAVTDFRTVGKLVKAIDEDFVDRSTVSQAVVRLIEDTSLSPKDVFDDIAAEGYRQQSLQRKAQVLSAELEQALAEAPFISDALRAQLIELKLIVSRVLGEPQ
ncbi:MAG: ParB/RepB/Spo0J family partition protein [Rhodoglobus sp.]